MYWFVSWMSWLKCLMLLICVVPARPFPQPNRPDPAIVDLGYAQYRGTNLEAFGVNQFLGMRFAKPPIGDLRWRSPRDPEDESHAGVQSASSFGPICIGVGQSSNSSSYSEDCLFISVFSPANATKASKLPVWFFIQGGGYAGDGNSDINGTQAVVQSGHNVVFVQLNYRVGALGFLASEKIRVNGDLNVGLLDQRKALRWVQNYIQLFGGDPNHVVIHGASSGGGSVAYHLTSYGGRDDRLFIGAIPESPFLPTSRTVAQSEFQFDRFVNATGCSGIFDEVECLRALDLATIQTANGDSPFPGASGPPEYYFLPVIDGDFSREQMYTQFSRGRFVRVPTMVGGDTNEGDIFVPNATTQAEVNDFLVDNFPYLDASDLKKIDVAYPPTPRAGHAPYFGQASAVYGNSTFACGGLFISTAVSLYVGESHSWNYRYNIIASTAAEGVGVTHTSELGYVFGTTEADQTPVLMGYYTSFVRTLNPNTYKDPTAPPFKEFNSNEQNRLVINLPIKDTDMETISEAQKDGCKLWYGLASTTEQ